MYISTADVDNTTALHLAAEEGSLDCVKELLAAGALCNTQTKTGNTALLLAAKRGKPLNNNNNNNNSNTGTAIIIITVIQEQQ